MEDFSVLNRVMTDKVYDTPTEVHCLESLGGYILVGLRSGKILIISSSDDEIEELEGHTAGVNSLAYYIKEDQNILASGGQDKFLIIWDMDSLEALSKIQSHSQVVTEVVIHNSFLYSISADCSLKVFELEGYTQVNELTQTLALTALSIGTVVCLGTDEGQMLFFDKSLQALSVKDVHSDTVWSISAWQSLAVSGGFDGSVHLWDLNEFSSRELGTHYGIVSKVLISDISESGLPIIFSAGSDYVIKIWSVRGFQDILEFHTDAVYSLAVDGFYLISGGFDKKLRRWSWVNTMKTEKKFISQEPINCGTIDSKGCVYYAIDNNLNVKDVKVIDCFDGLVTCIDIDEEYGVLVCGSRDRTVKQFDLGTLELKNTYEHASSVAAVACLGNIVVSGSHDGTIVAGENMKSFEQPISSLSMNEDLLFVGVGNRVLVCTLSLEVVLEKDFESVESLVLESEYLLVSTQFKISVLGAEDLETRYVQETPCTYRHLRRLKNSDLYACAGNYIFKIPNYVQELRRLSLS